jgi:hypothetical protein
MATEHGPGRSAADAASGCQPSASISVESSRSGIPNAAAPVLLDRIARIIDGELSDASWIACRDAAAKIIEALPVPLPAATIRCLAPSLPDSAQVALSISGTPFYHLSLGALRAATVSA